MICLKLVLWPLKRFNTAKTILVSVLKSILKIDFISPRVHVVLSTRKCLRLRCLQNEDVVDQCIGTWNYSFSLFCMNNSFVSKDVAIEVAVADGKVPVPKCRTSRQANLRSNWKFLFHLIQFLFLINTKLFVIWNDMYNSRWILLEMIISARLNLPI